MRQRRWGRVGKGGEEEGGKIPVFMRYFFLLVNVFPLSVGASVCSHSRSFALALHERTFSNAPPPVQVAAHPRDPCADHTFVQHSLRPWDLAASLMT